MALQATALCMRLFVSLKIISNSSLLGLNGRLMDLMPFFEIERNDKRKIKEAMSKPSYKNLRVLSVYLQLFLTKDDT